MKKTGLWEAFTRGLADLFEGDVMRRFSLSCSLALAALVAGIGGAQAASVKEIFENYNLLGTFALDCSQPASDKNWYFVHRIVDENHVQRDMMVGPTARKFVFIFDKASVSRPNEIAVSGTRDSQPIESVWRVEQNRQIEIESTLRGNKVISDAKFLSNRQEVPWINKCGTPGR